MAAEAIAALLPMARMENAGPETAVSMMLPISDLFLECPGLPVLQHLPIFLNLLAEASGMAVEEEFLSEEMLENLLTMFTTVITICKGSPHARKRLFFLGGGGGGTVIRCKDQEVDRERERRGKKKKKKKKKKRRRRRR